MPLIVRWALQDYTNYLYINLFLRADKFVNVVYNRWSMVCMRVLYGL